MEPLLQDLRFAARLLRKSPGLTAVSVLALTLGIGLTVTMYSVVYGALMRGLPFEGGDRIMAVALSDRASTEDNWQPISFHDYRDWRDQQRAFSGLSALYTGTINVTDGERPERFDGGFVTADLFATLGVQPMLGRGFTPEDDQPGAPWVMVLSHDTWTGAFGGDPAVLGRTVRANGEQATIIGVMPPRFRFPVDEKMWVPLRFDVARFDRGQGQSLNVVGKLRPEVTREAAALELAGIHGQIVAAHPRPGPETLAPRVEPYTERFIGKEPRAMLFTMLGAVFLVLLVACANVANLLLSRAAMRSKEVGVRTALGATRFRVVLQFLAESIVLSTAGALFGLVFAWVGIALFNRAIAPTDPPFWIDIRLDGPVLLFVVAVTAIASIVSGAFPAWQAARADVNEILKDESRGGSSFRMGRLSKGLVIAEIALSCGLLVGAGLMIKSVSNLGTVDFGFPTKTIFTARVGLPEVDYQDRAAQIRFFEELAPRLASIGGVGAASLTSSLPALGAWAPPISIEGVTYVDPERDRPAASRIIIAPGFFSTFDLAITSGRDFGIEDRLGTQPVAIVNASFARTHFAGESPLGRQVRFATPASTDTLAPWLTIVGVVPDMYASGLDNERPEAVYLPLSQNGVRFMSIVARTHGEPLSVTGDVRAAVAAVDPDIPLYFVNTLAGMVAENTWFYRIFGTLFMIFGLAALLLAAMGLYAVMSFSVSRRTREVGVRMALGAHARDVVRLIVRQALTQIGVGLALGLVLAASVSQLLAMLLFNVHPRDPWVFGSIVLLLTVTGLAASAVPARRAARVEPQSALRAD